jgi:uncharacterized ParB-like nuclease family protein
MDGSSCFASGTATRQRAAADSRQMLGDRHFISTLKDVPWASEANERASPMLKRESLRIDKVYVPVKRRATLKPEVVREIAESILEIGQQTPILVRRDGDRFVLVEGFHRLEACKALGEEMILGYLVSAEASRQTPSSPSDPEAEAIREKTDRLRKLRLMREAEEKTSGTPSSSPAEESKHSGRMPKRSQPATLSDWLAARERDGFRN